MCTASSPWVDFIDKFPPVKIDAYSTISLHHVKWKNKYFRILHSMWYHIDEIEREKKKEKEK